MIANYKSKRGKQKDTPDSSEVLDRTFFVGLLIDLSEYIMQNQSLPKKFHGKLGRS